MNRRIFFKIVCFDKDETKLTSWQKPVSVLSSREVINAGLIGVDHVGVHRLGANSVSIGVLVYPQYSIEWSRELPTWFYLKPGIRANMLWGVTRFCLDEPGKDKDMVVGRASISYQEGMTIRDYENDVNLPFSTDYLVPIGVIDMCLFRR